MPSELPARIAARPVCVKRKLPIPYSVRVLEGGIGDFSRVDADLIDDCLKMRLCGVCGQYMEYWIAFIGGPYSAGKNGAYTDPGMHEECAEWSMRLCPFIGREKVPRRTTDEEPIIDPRVVTVDNQKNTDGWVMLIARSYTLSPAPHGDGTATMLILPKGVARRREFAYVNGKLTETTSA